MLIDRRQTLVLLSATASMLMVPASFAFADGTAAIAPQPFTAAAFDAAQKAGKPILVDTFATWCQICARQAPVIEKLRAEPKFKSLVIFRVDFDTQKDVMRRLHETAQSTLIVFRGDKEVGRSTGETQPEWIEDLLDKTVQNGTT